MTDKNSICRHNLYHDYQIVRTTENGVVEMCTKCKKRVYFRNNVPNIVYLSHHLRSMLRPGNYKYLRHYATTTA